MAVFASLIDDFSGASLDTAQWEANAAATLVLGELRITPTSEAAVTFRSLPSYTIDESFVALRVSPLPATGTSATTEIRVGPRAPDGDDLGFVVNTVAGTVRCEVREGGVVASTSAAIPYSATAHAWLRIRVTSGLVAWEVSAHGDEAGWVALRANVAAPSWVTSASQDLHVTAKRTGGANGGYVALDSVNVEGVPPGGPPLVDDFDTTALPARWARSVGSPTLTGGRVVLDAEDALLSEERVDLTGVAQWVDLFSVSTATTAETVYAMTSDNGGLRFRISTATGGVQTLTAEIINANGTTTTVGTRTFTLASMHVLQFRETGGRVFFEYGSSPSGAMTAVEAAGRTVPFSLRSLAVELFEKYATGAAPGAYASTYEGTY